MTSFGYVMWFTYIHQEHFTGTGEIRVPVSNLDE